MDNRLVTVFGGSGFVGRHVVQQLAERGYRIRVAVRDPEAGAFLKPMGDVGQIALVQANIRDDGSVARAVAGAGMVVNAVGILYESGPQKFAAIHHDGAVRVARAAAQAGASRLVHISAIGSNKASEAQYAKTKAAGEAGVREAFPGVTILRPSVVFGPEDDFFNRFGALARMLPFLPLIGGGETRFQPVYVGDVARAVVAVLEDGETAGGLYELGGPKIYSFRELMELVLRETGRRRLLVPVPYWVAMLQATFLQLLPVPPLTRDQVRLLQSDNVVADAAAGLKDLGVTPAPAETIVPSYLARFRKPGKKGLAASQS
jgi:NADH dehydrogenase